MFGIGFFEAIIIAGIALVAIGPEKFPDFAKLVVRTIRELRGYMDDLKAEVGKELKPVKEELRTLKEQSSEKYIESLSNPTLTPYTPPKEEKPAVDDAVKNDEPVAENVSDADADTTAPNPEPEERAWQRQEYKVAGGDEFENPDFKGPERMD